jgi:hypothetical protein
VKIDGLVAGTESQLNRLNLEKFEGSPHFFNIIEMNFTELKGSRINQENRNIAQIFLQ